MQESLSDWLAASRKRQGERALRSLWPLWVLSVLTIRKGLLGIAAFLCTVLPHGLVYLLVWYVLSGWSGQIQKKLHILPGLLLLIITGAGAFLEVFVSPFLWGLFP